MWRQVTRVGGQGEAGAPPPPPSPLRRHSQQLPPRAVQRATTVASLEGCSLPPREEAPCAPAGSPHPGCRRTPKGRGARVPAPSSRGSTTPSPCPTPHQRRTSSRVQLKSFAADKVRPPSLWAGRRTNDTAAAAALNAPHARAPRLGGAAAALTVSRRAQHSARQVTGPRPPAQFQDANYSSGQI
jgi:hypothetical protein